MYYEQEFVIDVLRKELIEFLFPLRFLSLLYLAVMILNKIYDIVADVHRRMNV